MIDELKLELGMGWNGLRCSNFGRYFFVFFFRTGTFNTLRGMSGVCSFYFSCIHSSQIGPCIHKSKHNSYSFSEGVHFVITFTHDA